MLNYIRAEIYKLFKQKIIYLTFIITLLYTLFANIIFYQNDLLGVDLYKNFINEYSLLYLFLILFYVSSSLSDEYNNGTIVYYNQRKLFLAKFIIFLFYLFILIIISFLISYVVSLLLFKKITKIYFLHNLKYFIFYLPVFIFLIIISYILTIILKKSAYASGFSYLIFFGLNYLSINYKNKFILSNCWDLNIVDNRVSALIINFVYLLVFLIIIYILTKKKK